MKRVRLRPGKPETQSTRLQRVRLETTDTLEDAVEQAERLIDEKMKAKWLPSNNEPKQFEDVKDWKSGAKIKRNSRILRNSHYADPFAYNNERHPRMIYRLRLLGHSLDRIAEIFMVAPSTVVAWRNNFPDFNQAYLEGGEEADAVVAQSLFRAATGWSHKGEKVQIMQDGRVIRASTTEKFPPNIAAAKFWLANRQGGKKGAWNEETKVTHNIVKETPVILVNPVAPAQLPAPTLEADTFRDIPNEDLVNSAYDDEDEDV